MTHRPFRTLLFAVAMMLPGIAHEARAQGPTVLPRTQADVLLDAGRWAEAEEVLYEATRRDPRDPQARANLGRYLAMKGALKPGLVLIEEAAQFGLRPATARTLAAPIRTLIDWRQQQKDGARDSTVVVRPAVDRVALLRLPVVRPNGRDTLWADLVPRMIGLDSAYGTSPRVGIEVLEGLLPSYDVASQRLRLHADPRSALKALGRRYPVLRTSREVRVLLAQGRVRPLDEALRELAPQWWQLDLVHGLLVVR